MEQGKRKRATTLVVMGMLGLIMFLSDGCGGYVGNGGGGGNNSYAITGTVVDYATKSPLAGAQVVLEQPDGNGIDRIIASTTSATNGTFSFTPPSTGVFDVVADDTAILASGITVTYAPTVTFGVLGNASLNQIPLVPESGRATPTGSPVTISGTISSAGSIGLPKPVDVSLSALLAVSPPVGSTVQLTVPTFSSTTKVTTSQNMSSCTTGTDCVIYSLIVPTGNFSFGLFNSSGTQYTLLLQQPTNLNYTVEGRAFFPMASLTTDCTPPSALAQIMLVNGNLSSATPNLTFSGCN